MQSAGDGRHDESAPTNRLSIAHLMLWMSTLSVALAIEVPLMDLQASMDADGTSPSVLPPGNLHRYLMLAMSPASAAGLAGACLATWRFVRREPGFPTQPGHWLLLLSAAGEVCSIGYMASATFVPHIADLPYAASFLVSAALYIVPTSTSAVAAIRTPEIAWRSYFLLLVVSFVGLALGMFGLFAVLSWGVFPGISLIVFIPSAASILVSLYGMALSLWEIRIGRRRDIFHWVGVCTLAASILGFVGHWIISALS